MHSDPGPYFAEVSFSIATQAQKTQASFESREVPVRLPRIPCEPFARECVILTALFSSLSCRKQGQTVPPFKHVAFMASPLILQAINALRSELQRTIASAPARDSSLNEISH